MPLRQLTRHFTLKDRRGLEPFHKRMSVLICWKKIEPLVALSFSRVTDGRRTCGLRSYTDVIDKDTPLTGPKIHAAGRPNERCGEDCLPLANTSRIAGGTGSSHSGYQRHLWLGNTFDLGQPARRRQQVIRRVSSVPPD